MQQGIDRWLSLRPLRQPQAGSTVRTGASSSRRRSARCSSGTTSICTARCPRSSRKQFFSGVNETTGFIFALLAFAAGFFVRPFGALVFGRLGDLVGRKHTFLITIVIMGVSTALVGLLPSYATHRRRCAGHSDRAAPAAGPGARRRIWWCGDLRCRTCAARASAASTRAGSRPRRRWACFCRCW